MKIAYTGGYETIVLRDVLDPRYNTWRMGDVRDVPDDLTIRAQDPWGQAIDRRAVDAILACGVQFVDSSTGKNPMFQCADCGEHVDADEFRPDIDAAVVPYENDAGDRLCVIDFLARHPEHEKYHTDRGLPLGLLHQVHARREQLTQPAPKPQPVASTVSSYADHEE